MSRESRAESLHARLKRATAHPHADLETLIESRRLFASLPGYVTFLRASLAFQTEAEQALAMCDAVAVIPDWGRRQRAQLARHDLEVLGYPCDERSPPAAHLTKVPSPEWVLGVAYVVEGATLGGGVLLKTVARLDVTPGRGAAFLASYGPRRSAMWQAFLATLASWEQRGVVAEKVIGAAAATFTAARLHFEASSS